VVLEASLLSTDQRARRRLQFTSGGEFHGFRASGLSAYDNVDPHTVVRELVQNSVDASVAAKREVVRLTVEIEEVATKDIPGLTEYQQRLECAIETQRKKNSLQQAQSIVEAMSASIKKPKVPVLWVLDNGIGLDDDGMERLLGDGQSAKSDESTAGSYGNGHMTSFPASELRYVLYGGVQKDGKRTVSGHTILASHMFQNKAYGKDGYLSKSMRFDDFFNRFEFFDGSEFRVLKHKLDHVEQEFRSGSSVGILAFNRFNRFDNDDDALDCITDVVATHFAPLVFDGGMEVTVRGGSQGERLLNADSIERILNARKLRLRRDRNSIGISGAQAWDAFETLKESPKTYIETAFGNVRFHVRELPRESAGRTHIQLFRNGMWISNEIPYNRPADFGNAAPFCGLVLLQPNEAKNACRFVRSFEGPRHIDIDLQRKRRNSPERSKIEKFFKELSDGIRSLAPKMSAEEFDPAFFSLEVPGGGVRTNPKSQTTGTGKPERVPRRNPQKLERRKQQGGKTKQLRRQGTLLKARSTAFRKKKGVQIFVKAQESASNTEVRVVIQNGCDETCDNPEPDSYLEILTGALVGGESVKRYVKDQNGKGRAVLVGPVSAESDELDIWLPCPSVPNGDLRVELIRRSTEQ